jgi:hypothetical protein
MHPTLGNPILSWRLRIASLSWDIVGRYFQLFFDTISNFRNSFLFQDLTGVACKRSKGKTQNPKGPINVLTKSLLIVSL